MLLPKFVIKSLLLPCMFLTLPGQFLCLLPSSCLAIAIVCTAAFGASMAVCVIAWVICVHLLFLFMFLATLKVFVYFSVLLLMPCNVTDLSKDKSWLF